MLSALVCAVCVGLAVAVVPTAGSIRARPPAGLGPSGPGPGVGAGPGPVALAPGSLTSGSSTSGSLTPADVAVLADQLAVLAVAGLPPPRIWAAVAEHGPTPAVRAVASQVVAAGRRGIAPARALRGVVLADPGRRGRQRGCAAAVHLAVAVDVSERTGAATAPTLQRFAAALRADERAARERSAALAGPQTTAAVLAVLPLAGLLLGAVMGGHPWHALLATPVGRGCLGLGGLLWFVGRRWTASLVRRAAGPP